MIAFSCNVPQIALTFGKYSTSGPIQLQTFFPERGEQWQKGGRRDYNVLKKSCFPAQPPGAETTGLPSQSPRCMASLIASTWEQGAGGRGGTEVSRAQSSRPHSKPSQRTYRESHIESDAWQQLPASGGHLLSTKPCFTHVTYMTSFASITTL